MALRGGSARVPRPWTAQLLGACPLPLSLPVGPLAWGPRSMPHPSGRPGPPLPLPLCPQEESHQLSCAQRCILLRVWTQDLPSILTQAFTSLLAFPPPQNTRPCLLPTTSPTWRNKVRCGEGFWASQPQWGSRTPPPAAPASPVLSSVTRGNTTHTWPRLSLSRLPWGLFSLPDPSSRYRCSL